MLSSDEEDEEKEVKGRTRKRKGFLKTGVRGIRQREKGRASWGDCIVALVSYVRLGLFPNMQNKTDNHEHPAPHRAVADTEEVTN